MLHQLTFELTLNNFEQVTELCIKNRANTFFFRRGGGGVPKHPCFSAKLFTCSTLVHLNNEPVFTLLLFTEGMYPLFCCFIGLSQIGYFTIYWLHIDICPNVILNFYFCSSKFYFVFIFVITYLFFTLLSTFMLVSLLCD